MTANKMRFLSDVITQVDRHNDLSDPLDIRRHQVAYSTTRTIIRYITSDVMLLAFAYNPGNAIVIFRKNGGLIAYGCFLDSFPAGKTYARFHWTCLEVEEAISRIRTDNWEASGSRDDVDFANKPARQWQELAEGFLEFTSYADRNIAISEFRKTYSQFINTCRYSILRLKSGRLRVEIDGSYFPLEEFLSVFLFFQAEIASTGVTINELPKIQYWKKVLSVSDLDEEIISELKIQSIAGKMRKAA